MSGANLASVVRPLIEAAVETAWKQWAAVGMPVAAKGNARALVDPEALVLASVAFGEYERRLPKVVRIWLPGGSRLLSVQRFKNLAPLFSPRTQQAARGLARLAMALAKDVRWRSLAGPKTADTKAAEPDVGAGPVLDHDSALGLRLRLGLGVGVKADLLTYLLGRQGSSATIQELAKSVAYQPRAVRRGAEELAAAHFVVARATSPVSYRVNAQVWQPLLGFSEELPLWRPWHVAFSFSDRLGYLASEAKSRGLSPYMQSSRVRDLLIEQAAILGSYNLLFVDQARYEGESLLLGLRAQVQTMIEWYRSCV